MDIFGDGGSDGLRFNDTDSDGTYEDEEEKTYKSYPNAKYNTTREFLNEVPNWQDLHPAKRFDS